MSFERPREQSKEENSMDTLQNMSFFSQVVERKNLDALKTALGDKNIEQAEKLFKSPLGIGHEVDQLRPKDIFSMLRIAEDPAYDMKREEVQKHYDMTIDAYRAVRQGEKGNQEELFSDFERKATDLYDALEILLPTNVREEYVNRELKKNEDWLKEEGNKEGNQDSQRKVAGVKERSGRLLEAKDRL